MKLSVKTSGAAPSEFVEFEVKQIADALENEISGTPAKDEQVNKMTQVFINQSGIKAIYSGGTFMYFKIPDEALDMFERI